MQFLLLGPFEVRDGESAVPLPRKKHRSLLGLLLLRAGTVVSADTLVDELWGERPPKTALAALRNYVSQLRSQLGSGLIETYGNGYVAHVEPDDIDVLRFERLAARAREETTPARRAAGLRAALGLWRGPALADLAYESFAAGEAARLEELRLTAREDLVDAELELGGHADLIPELEALIAEHRFRERLRGQLMLALYRAGRQAQALDTYRAARTFLRDELGLEPGVRLRELEQAILRQEPALDLHAGLPPVEERLKTVTVLLCELMSPPAEVDPERLRRRTVRALGEARAAIERHGGSVETRAGDDLLGVFGIPVAHEDDALRAVRAASELREAVPDLLFGIETGEVLVGHGFVSGAVVARAKRLQRDAMPGDVLLGGSTLAVCGSAVAADAQDGAFRLRTVAPGTESIVRAPDAPLVGRRREVGALRATFADAVTDRRCRLVTVLGEPGIGKSRLARELVADIHGEATVLAGRCISYGEGATWLPLGELLKQAGGRIDPILAAAGSPGEVFDAARRVFEELAAERPLILVVDDLHWAEPTLLDFVEYLAARGEGPILCLCLARPELADHRPDWPGEVIRLEPLSAAQSRVLADDVDQSLRDRLVDAAGGNPLFLEQLIAYAGESESAGLPPSIEALIAARLDRLTPEQLDLLQRAAVIGWRFRRDALQELGADTAILPGIDGRGLVRRIPSGFAFQHLVVREVAYSSLPREQRAELHERLADWLETNGEAAELVGHHLEQAFRYRDAVGLSGGRTRRLATDAGRRLGEAGIAAWKHGDVPAATNLLGRAVELLPERDAPRLVLLCELGPALRTGGDFEQARKELSEAVALAEAPPIELRARLELAGVCMASDPARSADEILDIAAEALPVFEAAGDERSQARTWRWIAFAHGGIRGRFAAATDAAERALELYTRTGWSTSGCLAALTTALHSGPTPVQEAIASCRDLLSEADAGGEANVLCALGGLEAMAGRFTDARALLERARALFDRLGQDAAAADICGFFEARIELLAGEPAVAEQVLRSKCDVLERMGDRAGLATGAADLAEALLCLGRDDEAERWCTLAEEIGAADDAWTQVGWRTAKAKLLAHKGRIPEAEALAREAVAWVEPTDALNHRAKTLLDLADVVRLGGRPGEAREAVAEALLLFGQKENLAGASQAESRLAKLAPA